jgi:hypothetical protein
MRNFTIMLLLTLCGLCKAQVKVSTARAKRACRMEAKADSSATEKLSTIRKTAQGGWSDAPKIYGYKINGNGWSWDSKHYGVYSYTADADATEDTVCSVNSSLNGEGGAVYANGKYYVLSYTKNNDVYTGTYDTYDAITWKRLASVSMTGVDDLAEATTYDATDSTAYCVTDGSDGYLHLSKWDLAHNKKVQISSVYHAFLVLASGLDGTLYGIDDAGDLYKINKTDGTDTKIGATGVTPSYFQTGVIDPETGKFYWLTMNNNNTANSFLYEVNTSTGAATLLKQLPDYTEVIGGYMAGTGVAPKAPARVSDLTATFENGSEVGSIDFKMPTKTLDGTEMTGTLAYAVMQDTTIVAAGTGVGCGEAVSTVVNAPYAGKHIYRVITANETGKGVPAEIIRWIGNDAPVAPEGIKFNNYNPMLVTSWNTPTKGVHGGYVDPSKITYDVVRYPEGKVVATDSHAPAFNETYTSDTMQVRYYGVTAKFESNASEEGLSNKQVLGKYVALPYVEGFDSEDDMAMITVIDHNNDGTTWQFEKQYNNDIKYNANDKNDADDYFVLPPVKLNTNGLYRLTFTPSVISTERLSIFMGNEPTADGMTRTLLEPTDFNSNNAYKPNSVEFTVDKDSLYHIGFRCTSRLNAWAFSIDDIKIEETAKLSAPNVVTDLSAVADQVDTTVTVTFTAPKVSIKGNPLTSLTKIEMYRTVYDSKTYTNVTSLYKTFDAPKAGEKIIFVDKTPALKTNTYKFIAYNEDGVGRDTTISAYIGADIPANVKALNFVDNGDGTGTVTWETPTTGYNGGTVDPKTIGYSFLIYHNGSYYADMQFDPGVNSYTDKKLPTTEQTCVYYVICPVNNQGGGGYTRSNFLMCGEPFAIPATETFKNRSVDYNPLFTDILHGSAHWLVQAEGKNGEMPKDGDGGFAEYSSLKAGDESSMNTPKFDASALATATLDFWALVPNEGVILSVNVSKDNGPQVPVMVISTSAEAKANNLSGIRRASGTGQWMHYSVPLDKFVGSKNLRLQFDGKSTVAGSSYMYIDHYTIDGTTGISTVNTSNVTVNALHGSILISGCNGNDVTIYSANGSEVFNASGKDDVNVSLASGMYLVKVAGKTMKAIVK